MILSFDTFRGSLKAKLNDSETFLITNYVIIEQELKYRLAISMWLVGSCIKILD